MGRGCESKGKETETGLVFVIILNLKFVMLESFGHRACRHTSELSSAQDLGEGAGAPAPASGGGSGGPRSAAAVIKYSVDLSKIS